MNTVRQFVSFATAATSLAVFVVVLSSSSSVMVVTNVTAAAPGVSIRHDTHTALLRGSSSSLSSSLPLSSVRTVAAAAVVEASEKNDPHEEEEKEKEEEEDYYQQYPPRKKPVRALQQQPVGTNSTPNNTNTMDCRPDPQDTNDWICSFRVTLAESSMTASPTKLPHTYTTCPPDQGSNVCVTATVEQYQPQPQQEEDNTDAIIDNAAFFDSLTNASPSQSTNDAVIIDSTNGNSNSNGNGDSDGSSSAVSSTSSSTATTATTAGVGTTTTGARCSRSRECIATNFCGGSPGASQCMDMGECQRDIDCYDPSNVFSIVGTACEGTFKCTGVVCTKICRTTVPVVSSSSSTSSTSTSISSSSAPVPAPMPPPPVPAPIPLPVPPPLLPLLPPPTTTTTTSSSTTTTGNTSSSTGTISSGAKFSGNEDTPTFDHSMLGAPGWGSSSCPATLPIGNDELLKCALPPETKCCYDVIGSRAIICQCTGNFFWNAGSIHECRQGSSSDC